MKVKIVYKVLGEPEHTRMVSIDSPGDIQKIIHEHNTDAKAHIIKLGGNYKIPMVVNGLTTMEMYNSQEAIIDTLQKHTEITQEMELPIKVVIDNEHL